jgi:hypothetical protein
MFKDWLRHVCGFVAGRFGIICNVGATDRRIYDHTWRHPQAVLFVGRRQGEEFGVQRVYIEPEERAALATRPYRTDKTLLSSYRQIRPPVTASLQPVAACRTYAVACR